ncbi:DUF805 domain-containing protein [Salinispora vitiensis]|uniref:DUF805 domain-containing protein n=1 Tax=Salinispora vitiensis TaxID=999544 RepID=UPI000380D256|nr:DUF805 domain-containing protein [Salinispora vitiensis]
MSFVDAVRSALTKYVGFSGRARRAEYWWFTLFLIVIGVAAALLNGALDTIAVVVVVNLALALPSLAVAVRRLHDTDRSGWMVLLALIPLVGTILLLVFLLKSGTSGPNRFGPDPKDPAASRS